MTITYRQRATGSSSRRLMLAMTWLGSTALVIGGTTSAAVATPDPGEQSAPVDNSLVTALADPAATTVPGQYVVVLKDQAGLRSAGLRTTTTAATVKAAAERGRKAGAEIRRQFTGPIQGYSATLSDAELSAVRADPAVASVQPNHIYRIDATTESAPVRHNSIRAAGTTETPESWGLDRVDERTLPLDHKYYRTATGKGVTALVIDSGMERGQQDLDHVKPGIDLVKDGNGTDDCLGHGTHVAGTIGGTDFGVAKEVTLVPIRVFGCQDGATTETVVAGIEAAVAYQAPGPKVVNLSLGDTAIDPVLDAAVTQAIKGGLPIVIAAGNGNAQGKGVSACSVSPGRVKTAITVGATTIKDKRATFSNYGSCVDLYAPGEDIVSDWISPDGDWWINEISGTSMAAPHVTGAVAMYLQRHPSATPAQVQSAIIRSATKNIVTRVSSRWPRLMLLALQPAVKPKSVTSGNKLKYNQSLVRGKKICSKNKAYCLSPESSGKLVLRKVTGKKKVVWTSGKRVYWSRMTSTGALSSYDTYGQRVWTSKKKGGKATLYVISSGYLKIVRNSDRKTLWTSKG